MNAKDPSLLAMPPDGREPKPSPAIHDQSHGNSQYLSHDSSVEDAEMDETERQKRRFVEMLREIVAEEGGNATAAGRRLGLTQSYVSKLLSGERSIGLVKMNKAVERIGLDRAYFSGPVGRSYRAYLRFVEPHPALRAFLSGPIGKEVSAEERAMLEGWSSERMEPTERIYELILTGIREHRRFQEAVEGAVATAKAEDEVLARGGRVPGRSKSKNKKSG